MRKLTLLSFTCIAFLLTSCFVTEKKERDEIFDDLCPIYENGVLTNSYEDCRAGTECCEPYGCVDLKQQKMNSCNTCMKGYQNCDGDWSNGCEVNLALFHQASCGKCVRGWADCDQDRANGCEVGLKRMNMTDCETCAEGWANCDGDWSNGCEVNLVELNLSDCSKCVEGFGDCSAQEPGCETNLAENNLKNCVDCIDGFANCDSYFGCEVRLENKHLATCNTCEEGYEKVYDGRLFECLKPCDSEQRDIEQCDGLEICNYDNYCRCADDSTLQLRDGRCVTKASLNMEDGNTHQSSHCASYNCDCLPGFANCGESWDLGCMYSLDDVNTCNYCSTSCEYDNAVAACDERKCQFVECHPNYYDCNGNQDDGCEVFSCEEDRSLVCQNRCNLPNVNTYKCSVDEDGKRYCDIEECVEGFDDCDNDPSNGCEAKILWPDDKKSHCGECGNDCRLFGDDAYCEYDKCVYW